MKLMQRVFTLFLLQAVMICASSCTNEELRAEIVETFQPFEPNEHVIQVHYEDQFVVGDHEVRLENLLPDNSELLHRWTIANQKIYFATLTGNGIISPFAIQIYECDLYGNDLNIVFQKNDIGFRHAVSAIGSAFYFTDENGLDSSNEANTDSYDVISEVYTENASQYSEWSSIENRNLRYDVSYDEKNNQLSIYDRKSDETALIDLHTLNSSEFEPILNKFSNRYLRTDICGDHIFISYYFDDTGYWEQPVLTVEYDFYSKEIYFATFCKAVDPMDYKVAYLE